jgi:uncharacterized protein (TIGR00304 family)
MNELLVIGFILVMLGMILIVVGSFLYAPGNVHSGGFVLIGPIPLVFGSDQNSANLAMVLGIILVVLAFLMFFWRSR